MTKPLQSKPVREARAKARAMARDEIAGYRQCLDIVAKDAGFQHWNAFSAAHEDGGVPSASDIVPEVVKAPASSRTRRKWYPTPIADLREIAHVDEGDDKMPGYASHLFKNGCTVTLLGIAMFLGLFGVLGEGGEDSMMFGFCLGLLAFLIMATMGMAHFVAVGRILLMARRRRLATKEMAA